MKVEYDAFAHLVSGLALSQETLVLIVPLDPLSLYCDASGNEREPITVVGGVLATVADWIALRPRWNEALAIDGIKVFHATEFANSFGEFAEGWKGNESRRRALIQRLLNVLAGTIKWWCGVAVQQSEFNKADVVYELHENFHPFALCGETCIDFALKWRYANRLEHLPLKYFFESGDHHWGQMSDRIKERFGERPIPGSKDDPPFQAADFVAYEVRTAYIDLVVKKDALFRKFGERFLRLGGQIDGSWGELLDESIRTELRLRNIPRRL
jgi:hypothetical protein